MLIPTCQEGLVTVVELRRKHDHSVQIAAALRYLSPSQDIRHVFEEYFKNELRITESIEYHSVKLETIQKLLIQHRMEFL